MNTKFDTNVSSRKLLSSAKYQGYNFTVSELFGESQQGGIPPPPRLGLNLQL